MIFIVFQIRCDFWLLRTICSIIIAPAREVKFRDFFLADQLASLVIVLYDLEFVICILTYDFWTGTGIFSLVATVTMQVTALNKIGGFGQLLLFYPTFGG